MDGVQIKYQGQPLPGLIEVKAVGPSTAFVKADAVMPVGTRLVLVCEAREIQIFVIRSIAEVEGPGMYIRADLSGDDKALWSTYQKRDDDFVFPEPDPGSRSRAVRETAESSRETVAVDADEVAAMLAEVDGDGVVEMADADDETVTNPVIDVGSPPPAVNAPPKSKKKGRKSTKR